MRKPECTVVHEIFESSVTQKLPFFVTLLSMKIEGISPSFNVNGAYEKIIFHLCRVAASDFVGMR